MTDPQATAAIELKGITKTFGTVVANDRVDLSVRQGEILALLGENGSGKTTLMNMLSGIYHPDSGVIRIRGQEVVIHSPKDAYALRIGMIHQHFKLVEVFTAAENIVLGTKNPGHRSMKVLKKEIGELSARYGLAVELDKRIDAMSVSEKQTVEILKVLYRGADILILDEPTAVLTPQETDRLFAILRTMREQGCAVIIITHKLHEVMAISDRVTVLRRGQSVDTVVTAQTTVEQLTEKMVGQAVSLSIDRPAAARDERILEVKGLTVRDALGHLALKEVSFHVDGGEILGVAGVAGSGQKELCETIAGLMKAESGAVLYRSDDILGQTPQEIIKHGISMSFIPEDRLGMGLVSTMDITDNMLLKSYKRGRPVVLNRKPAREMAERLIDKLNIVTPGVSTPVRYLSGGNVQKVLLGREIESQPQVLITAYPVRGLDIHSSYRIYDLLNEQKQRGVAVLYIGEDLDVLLELCDRILVLCHGEVTGIVDAAQTTKEQLGLLMTGVRQEGGESDD